MFKEIHVSQRQQQQQQLLCNSRSSSCSNRSASLTTCALICMATLMVVLSECSFSAALPTSPVNNLFSSGNKYDEKADQTAERSFQQFIQSAPESTLIGKLKPNATEFDLMILKNKIANSILSMQQQQEAEKAAAAHLQSTTKMADQHVAAECFIEVTVVQRVAGKCQKVNNGLPICQSENYMAINPDCN